MGTSWAEVARVAVGLTAPREEVDDELPAWVDAIEARDVERVRGLSFDVNTVWIDDRGRPLTPLGLAVLWLHAPMVNLLLDRGAHPDGTFRDGWTPLGLAMHLHSSDGAFHVDGHPWPPVLSAVQEATMRIARLLVERGASSKAVCVANFRRLGSLVESLRAVGPSVPTSTHREARRSIHAHLRRRRWRDLQWIALLLFRCWLAGLALGATGVVRWFSMLIDRDVGEGVLWGAVWGGCGPFAAAASMGAVPLVLPVLPVAGPFYFDLDLFVRAWKILASLYGFFFGAAILFTVARALVDHRQRIRNLCSPLELAVNYRPMFVTLLVDHGARLEHVRPEHQRCITPQMWHHQQSVVLCLRVRHALIVHIQRINAHVDRRLLRMIFTHYVWPARLHVVSPLSK